MQPAASTRWTYVFDLGNVLIRWDPRNLYRKRYGGDTAAMEWFLANVCTSEWNERHDAGQPFAKGIAELVERFPEHAEPVQDYFARWEEMLGGPIDENVALLAELKERGAPVLALSNWSLETFPVAQRRYAFLKLFDGIVLSGEERLIKPDPAIYRVLLERYGLRPEATIFIDDAERNVAAAAALGIVAIHYRPGMDLRARLAADGLL